jgi:hypothetical protein
LNSGVPHRTIARFKKITGTFPATAASRAERMIKTDRLSKRYDSLTAVDVTFR